MKTRIRYAAMQGCYWALFCGYSGYVVYFMDKKGLSTWLIGILTAAFGALSAISQPLLGKMADREKPNWKILLLILAGVNILINVLLLFVEAPFASGLLYAAMALSLGGMIPLINSVCFSIQAAGEKIQFGPPRAIGSLGSAIGSLLLGKLTAAFGPTVLPIYELIVTVIAIAVFCSMKYYPRPQTKTGAQLQESAGKKKSMPARYPMFFVMWAGCVLIMLFHNMTNVYLINVIERVGGDSADLGVSLSIAAAVEIPMMFLFATIAKKFSSKSLIVFSGIMFFLKGVGYCVAGNVAVIYATQILQMFSFAVFATATVYYSHERMLPEDEAKGQAFMSNTMTLGTLLGNLLGGWILSASGVKTMLITALVFAGLGTAITLFACTEKKKNIPAGNSVV